MALASWFRGDPLPYLSPVEGLTIEVLEDDAEMAVLNGLAPGAIAARRAGRNRPYVARLFGRAVAYGWVASGTAHIGELGLSFHVGLRERYLWDFQTLPFCRGKGIYPRLLQAIVEREDADRFWIIHAPENLPSGVGIGRAGFTEVGELSLTPAARPALRPCGETSRWLAALDLLGLPLYAGDLADCWTCHGPGGGGCTCTAESSCGCRRPAVGRAIPNGAEAPAPAALR